ncbi:hypothetical protein MBT84_29695 [Streptomyces sp. MBT84]|uniref:hypothetical protein n=1 Tax=Streptomyces sp. MBT84 TaxID=1488414 RepID=UPI001C6DF39B|nr:hypothetical protein [Streptomyces sp. MBT84]MBW8703776.1 hypothetical protein [Streptomyces sp. MBT84]
MISLVFPMAVGLVVAVIGGVVALGLLAAVLGGRSLLRAKMRGPVRAFDSSDPVR